MKSPEYGSGTAAGAFSSCYAEKAGRIITDLRSRSYREVQRVYRICKEEVLNLRSKRPKRNKAASHRLERLQLAGINECWSMNFVADHWIELDPALTAENSEP